MRLTGDNFRAASKCPTEQISFSISNNKDSLHSPYAQMLSSLWRGAETRINVEIHTAEHCTEVKSLLLEGKDPKHETKEFTEFQQAHFGKYVIFYFSQIQEKTYNTRMLYHTSDSKLFPHRD